MASSPPPDQHMSSSMVSPWAVVAFNNPLQEELKNLPPAIMVGSNGVSLSPAPLSSQASKGGSSKKVSKRRLKPSTKPPIRVLSTDTSNFKELVHELTGIVSNFREMVHELTGIVPTSSSMQGIRFQQLPGNNPSAVLKRTATRPSSQNDAADVAAAAQTLPPALGDHTSSAYDLLPSQKSLVMHDEFNNISSDLRSLPHPQRSLCNSTAFYYYSPSSSGADLKSLFARQCDASKNTSMYMERAVGEVSGPEMLDMEHVLQPAELASCDDNLDGLFPCNMLQNVDSWLPSDAIPSPFHDPSLLWH